MISHTCDQVALEAPDSNSEKAWPNGQIKVKRNHERMMEVHVPKTKGKGKGRELAREAYLASEYKKTSCPS